MVILDWAVVAIIAIGLVFSATYCAHHALASGNPLHPGVCRVSGH